MEWDRAVMDSCARHDDLPAPALISSCSNDPHTPGGWKAISFHGRFVSKAGSRDEVVSASVLHFRECIVFGQDHGVWAVRCSLTHCPKRRRTATDPVFHGEPGGPKQVRQLLKRLHLVGTSPGLHVDFLADANQCRSVAVNHLINPSQA